MNLLKLIRYRFFLFAGLLPYLLGQVVAFSIAGKINWPYFWWGFIGIFFVLVAVELFNEYFDAKEGGDRIFSPQQPEIPHWFYKLGISALAIAFIIGLGSFNRGDCNPVIQFPLPLIDICSFIS